MSCSILETWTYKNIRIILEIDDTTGVSYPRRDRIWLKENNRNSVQNVIRFRHKRFKRDIVDYSPYDSKLSFPRKHRPSAT